MSEWVNGKRINYFKLNGLFKWKKHIQLTQCTWLMENELNRPPCSFKLSINWNAKSNWKLHAMNPTKPGKLVVKIVKIVKIVMNDFHSDELFFGRHKTLKSQFTNTTIVIQMFYVEKMKVYADLLYCQNFKRYLYFCAEHQKICHFFV